MATSQPANVVLPPVNVTLHRVTHFELSLKTYYSPLADDIAGLAPRIVRARVRDFAQRIFLKFDPKITLELTSTHGEDGLEIALVGAHPHGFSSMSATLFDVGARLVLHPAVEQGDYREIPCQAPDGSATTRACRDFFVRFDVEIAFNPGIATRLVPVRLQLPVQGPIGVKPPSSLPFASNGSARA